MADALSPILIFVLVTAAVIALASLTSPARERVSGRLRQLADDHPAAPAADPTGSRSALGRLADEALPTLAAPLAPAEGAKRDELLRRMVHAGYYHPRALPTFLAVKLAVLTAPWVAGTAAALTAALDAQTCLVAACAASAGGMIAPGLWLDHRTANRHAAMRAGLPDFFDILVLCLEGGMGFSAAWRRVAGELREPYPVLWQELAIVEREMDLGRPLAEALRHFAERTDLDEIVGLASVAGQAERVGTGLAKPLRTLSDGLRLRRVQRAEEAAHAAATKVVFPTLLFIFPGVFAIIVAPIALQVMGLFAGTPK